MLTHPSSSLLGEYIHTETDNKSLVPNYSFDTIENHEPKKISGNTTSNTTLNGKFIAENNSSLTDTPNTINIIDDEDSRIKSSSINNENISYMEGNVFFWLNSVLSIIINNSIVYHRQSVSSSIKKNNNNRYDVYEDQSTGLPYDLQKFLDLSEDYDDNSMRNSLQLNTVCSVLKSICSQLERIIKYQIECDAATNFTDSSTTISSSNIDNNDKKNILILNNKKKIFYLRGICTQVLSEYRGAVLHLLSFDSVRETSRVMTGLSLLNSLSGTSLGVGCGLWLADVLRRITQVRYKKERERQTDRQTNNTEREDDRD